jgi:hypothetical protein
VDGQLAALLAPHHHGVSIAAFLAATGMWLVMVA